MRTGFTYLFATFPLIASLAFPVFADDPPTEIPVHTLKPQEYHITISDLPKPFATKSASKGPQVDEMPPHGVFLNLPPGFKVSLYAKGLHMPRWLALTPEGDVLVTETFDNRITRLHGIQPDGTVQQTSVFATKDNGLNRPFGMAFTKDSFFLGNGDGIVRFPYKKGQGALTGTGTKILPLPEGGHWTRNVNAAPDGKWLYVSVGSKSNLGEEPSPRASILRMRPDGSEVTIFTSGTRNPTGFAFEPVTHQPYTTVQERDELGDDLVCDSFTHVSEDAFYGWPYAYLSPQNLDPRMLKDGKSPAPGLAAKTLTPDVLFQAHSSTMAIAFATGAQFPEHYRNGAFVALRGSWNRSIGTGYKLAFVPFDEQHKPKGYYEDFLTGFLIDPAIPETWGRPVGEVFLPDGSLLFTEEMNGRIYRVRYEK